MIPDSDLLIRAASGDQSAAERLLERYWGLAFRVALRLTSDPALAEDSARGAFLKAFAGPERFDPQRLFRPWFLTLAASEALMISRSASRPQAHEGPALRAQAEDALTQVDLREAVATHLSRLEERLRVPLSLHYLDGLTHAEVGEVLSCPKSTAATRIRDGLALLRTRVPAPLLAIALVPLSALLSEAGQAEQISPAPSAASVLSEGSSLGAGLVVSVLAGLALLIGGALATATLLRGGDAAGDSVAGGRERAGSSAGDTLAPSGTPGRAALEGNEASPAEGPDAQVEPSKAGALQRNGLRGTVKIHGRRPPPGLALVVLVRRIPSLPNGALLDIDCHQDPLFDVLRTAFKDQPYSLRITPAALGLNTPEVSFRLRGVSLGRVLRLLVGGTEGLAYQVRDREVLVGTTAELGPVRIRAVVDAEGAFHCADFRPDPLALWDVELRGEALEAERAGSASPERLVVRAGGLSVDASQFVLSSPLELDLLEFKVDDQVLDQRTGLPLPGARVVSLGAELAVADAEGRVRFAWPWLHQVSLQRPGYAPQDLGASGEVSWPVRLEPVATFSGLVLTSGGVPVPNATVWGPSPRLSREVRAYLGAGLGPLDRARAIVLTTDAKGRYELKIPTRFDPPPYLEARGEQAGKVLLGHVQGGRGRGSFPPLVLAEGREVKGRVMDPSGRPLVAAEVTFLAGRKWLSSRPTVATPPAGNQSESPEPTPEAKGKTEPAEPTREDDWADEWATDAWSSEAEDLGWDRVRTDKAGCFTLPFAPRGDLRLRISADGRSEEFDLPAGSPAEFLFSGTPPPLFDTHVTVEGPQGQTLGRHTIQAYPARSLALTKPQTAHVEGSDLAHELRRIQPLWQRQVSLLEPLATASGLSKLLSLEPGRYDLLVRASGGPPLGTVFLAQRLPGRGETITLRLPAEVGETVSLGGIQRQNRSDRSLTLTDARGAWIAPPQALGWRGEELRLSPGHYRLHVACPGFEPRQLSLGVEEGKSLAPELTLVRGGRGLVVELTAPPGQALAVALVVIRDEKGRILRVLPGAEAKLELAGLPKRGPLKVEALAWPTTDLSPEPARGAGSAPPVEGEDEEFARVPIELHEP